MAETERKIQLHGRIFITGSIEIVTGLHIRAARRALAIGGLDNPVVRNPVTGRPYIPGSSLKGKLRSLLEKHYNKSQQWAMGGVRIHACYKFDEKGNRIPDEEAYLNCQVCPIFGIPAGFAVLPTRLIVRDVPLDENSAQRLARTRTELPFTEVKWETSLDRVTAAATPRQVERVPAGAIFAPLELVYNVYEEADVNRFMHLLDAMQFLEDDYLGGLGTRGSGKIAFQELSLTARTRERYLEEKTFEKGLSLRELTAKEEETMNWLHQTFSW